MPGLLKSLPVLLSSPRRLPPPLNLTQRPAGSLGAGRIGVVACPASPPVFYLLLAVAFALPICLPPSIYLLFPADANAGLVEKRRRVNSGAVG